MVRATPTSLSVDAAVVGAGPSGSTAATYLSEAGLKTVLIEKKHLPRDKTCAGVLPPRVLEDFEVPEDVIERHLEGIKVHAPSGAFAEIHFHGEGAVVSRRMLDEHIAQRASELGCLVIDGTGVVTITSQNDLKVLKLDNGGIVSTHHMIAADGIYSTVAAKMGVGWRRNDLAITLQKRFRASEKIIDSLIGDWFEVFYDSELTPMGWSWIAPQRNNVLVGAGVPAWLGLSSRFLESAIHRTIKNRLGSGAKMLKLASVEVHSIPIKGMKKSLVHNGIILVGDAGGFVRSDTGEGIHYAMLSGKAAAEAINETSQRNQLSRNLEHALNVNQLAQLREQSTELSDALSSNETIEDYVRQLRKLSFAF